MNRRTISLLLSIVMCLTALLPTIAAAVVNVGDVGGAMGMHHGADHPTMAMSPEPASGGQSHDCCEGGAVSVQCDCICLPITAVTSAALDLRQSSVGHHYLEPLTIPYPSPFMRALRPPIS